MDSLAISASRGASPILERAALQMSSADGVSGWSKDSLIIVPYVLEETDAECITFGDTLVNATSGMYASVFSSGAFFADLFI